MSEGKVPDPDSSDEMQQEEDTASSNPAEPPTETSSSENNPMEIADDPEKDQPKTIVNLQEPKDASPSKLNIKVKSPCSPTTKITSPKKSPGKSPVKGKRQSPSKPSEDVQSPSKRKSLEVKTLDESTMEISSSVEGKSDFSSLGDQPSSSEMQAASGSSQAPSADTSHPSHAGPSGVSQASSSDPSDPAHVCEATCVHGGARPKTRALTITANRSSGRQDDLSRVVDEMNSFAEIMGTRFSRNPEGFGRVGQPEWTRNIENTRVSVEQLAGSLGHGPFTHNTSDNGHPHFYPTILQLNRMFTGMSLEAVNIFEPSLPQRGQQEPRQPAIDVSLAPESMRRMDVGESNSFSGWRVPEEEPMQPMDQEAGDEQPRVEPQQQRGVYRVARLPPREPQVVPNIINPSHPYRHRDEGMWRAAMMTAYRSERYHSNDLLDDTISRLDRLGVSQEEFFRSYHSARKIDLYRDEGLDEEHSEPEREEMTIEDKINRVIVAVGFMTVAMLYMRLYAAQHPEVDTSSESSTMDSGNVDRSESEPKADYTRLREHVNIEPGSSDSTESPKEVSLSEDNSPREIQSPDIVPANRDSPVDVLVPLGQVPTRSETPSSQSSLIIESDPSGSSSSSSKKGMSLRKAVLGKQHSLSLDNTSSDASPIHPDDENKEPRHFGQLMNLCIQNLFMAAEEEGGSRDRETGEAPGDQDQSKPLDHREDPSVVVSQADSLKTEGIEGEVSQPGDVSLASTSGDVGDDVKTEETHSASGSNVVEDDSNMEDAEDDSSKSSQSRKRKEHSDIGEDRLAKRGKES